MNTPEDHDIDALLRDAFEGSTPDAGFSDRVMRQLPHRRRPSAWPLVVGLVAGALLCALNLFASPLFRDAWRGWLAGDWSGPTVVMLAVAAAMSLLALGWTLAEAEDH